MGVGGMSRSIWCNYDKSTFDETPDERNRNIQNMWRAIEPAIKAKVQKTMIRIRLAEEKIVAHYKEHKMRCPIHLSIGQEHVAADILVGSQAVEKQVVFASHRCHAPYIAAGGSLYKMFAELHGLPSGCCGGRGGSMHLYDPDAGFLGTSALLGGILPIAFGYSRASPDVRVIAFVGEGAFEENLFPYLGWCNGQTRYSGNPFFLDYETASPFGDDFSCDFRVAVESNGYSGSRETMFVRNCNRWMVHCGVERGPDYGKDDPITDWSSRDEVQAEVDEAWERVQRELR